MKRKFTKMAAAVALLFSLCIPIMGWGQTRDNITETMTADDLPATSTSYVDFSNVALTNGSDARYAGQSAKDSSGNIQLRSKNSNSGIVSTTSGGKIKTIKITVGSSSSNTISVYGNNTAYTSATDLYATGSNSNQGALIQEITSTTTITVSTDYAYVGIRSKSGAVYISSIEFTWEPVGGSSTEPSISGTAPAALNYAAGTGAYFEYTVTNPVDGGTVSAAVADPSTSWISNIQVNSSSTPTTVSFDYAANPNYLARTETVTLTYTYNTDQTKTATVTVTQNGDPNGIGSEANPLTVAQARALIDGLNGGTSGEVYVTGIVSAIPYAYNSTNNNITFNMVDNSGDANFLQAFKCTGTGISEVAVNDVAVVKGNLTLYTNGTYEFTQGCQLVSLTHPAGTVLDPVFTPAAGGYSSGRQVEITCATSGAAIYYTTDGTTDPTNASTLYTGAISVTQNTTIKAIAYDGTNYSDVVTANYQLLSDNSTTVHTVAEALEFGTYPQNGVFVRGTVCTAPTSLYNSTMLTYYISDDGTETDRLQVFRGKGVDNANFTAATDIQVGDIVIVYGNVKIFNEQKEFDQGNYLVSLIRPATINADDVEITYDATSGSIDYIIANGTGTVTATITDGNWLTLGTATASTVPFTCSANSSATARTATVTLSLGSVSKSVTVTQAGVPVPVINADDVSIAYDATSGSIDYTITNPVTGTNITASVPTGSWITLGTETASTVPFTCTANDGTTARTETVTLTYGSVTKNVTVTQAAYSTTYDGTGVFTKVTTNTTNDLEDGKYYVLTYGEHALKAEYYDASANKKEMKSSSVTVTSDQITNPYKKLVWKLVKVNDTDWRLYNDSTAQYCSITANDSQGYTLEETPTVSYTISNPTTSSTNYNPTDNYIFQTTATGNRCIAYYSNNNSFRSYTNSNSNAIHLTLYKLGPVSTEPAIAVSPDEVSSNASGETKTLDITVANLGIDVTQPEDYLSNFSAEFCSSTGGAISPRPDFIAFDFAVVSGTYVVQCTFTGNTGAAREGYFHVIYDDGTINVASNVVHATQDAYVAPVASITLDEYEINAPAAGTNGSMTVTLTNMTITDVDNQFSIDFFHQDGSDFNPGEEKPDWVHADFTLVNNVYSMNYTVDANTETTERNAYFKVYGLDDNGSTDAYSELVTVTQAGFTTTTTYTLTDQIISGKSYIIVSYYETNEKYYAMGEQRSNNRKAVEISVNGDVATVSGDEVYEFVISEVENETGYYSIYDGNANSTGYLYAAASGNNHLKTESTLSNDSKWNISIDATTKNATILADQSSNRNLMRYNYNSNNPAIFSCYEDKTNPTGVAPMLFVKNETYTLPIAGYDESTNGGWHLIASPVGSAITPSNTNGFIPNNPSNNTPDVQSDNYDLYIFDQVGVEGKEWLNYKVVNVSNEHVNFSTIENGKGYLYASKYGTTLTFTGTPYGGDGKVTLINNVGENTTTHFGGWNLIGNPFGTAAVLKDETGTSNQAYYKMNSTGTAIVAGTLGVDIAAMEGVFVVAAEDGDEVYFTPVSQTAPVQPTPQFSINVSRKRGVVIDRAIVRFDEGGLLPKLQLNPNNTKIYITEGNQDYAVVRGENEGEMPVSFKASENGNYTLSVNIENVEMNYLHLIDNMTGADVDLLATPSYSFEARTTDYASRFRLVFSANNGSNENGNETFAYYNGSEWVISNMGEATLQVVDVMGRVLSSETVSGNANVSLNQTPGVYMLRLVNGDSVKTQKIVVR